MSGRPLRLGTGATLVAAQFALLAALGWLVWPALSTGRLPGLAVGLGAAGLALGLWSLLANRPGNFNIRPLPRAGGRLVRHGPYRWVRHPMYSALLLAGAGVVVAVPGWAAALAWAALAAVLGAKSVIEERWMQAAHPGYAAYRAQTRRFVPWLL